MDGAVVADALFHVRAHHGAGVTGVFAGRELPRQASRPELFVSGPRGASMASDQPLSATAPRRLNVMQSLLDYSLLIAYKSPLTFTLWRASVHTWHSPGPVVAPGVGSCGSATPGKPMPAAGETAHVRRLLVDRSRCGLGVSPAPMGDTESPG